MRQRARPDLWEPRGGNLPGPPDVRQAKPGEGGCRDLSRAETFYSTPAGTQPRPTKPGPRSEASLAWFGGNPGCEA